MSVFDVTEARGDHTPLSSVRLFCRVAKARKAVEY